MAEGEMDISRTSRNVGRRRRQPQTQLQATDSPARQPPIFGLIAGYAIVVKFHSNQQERTHTTTVSVCGISDEVQVDAFMVSSYDTHSRGRAGYRDASSADCSRQKHAK